jgi:arylsulfatase A-like enzyme
MKDNIQIFGKPAVTLLSACLLFSSGCTETRVNKSKISFKEPPNIVLITLDDSNNWIGAFGGQAKTPNIDKLASEGRMFLRSYCVSPSCNPSRTALLTGQRPETTGQYLNSSSFREKPGGMDRATLPQYLRSHGYETVAAGKIFHMPRGESEQPDAISDDISWNEQWVGTFGTPGWELYWNDDGYAKWLRGKEKEFIADSRISSHAARYWMWGPVPYAREECGDWKLMDFGVKYLEREHDKPFFLALGTQMPHIPHIVPQTYFDLYPLDQIKLPHVPENEMDDIPEIARTSELSVLLSLMKELGEYRNAVQAYLAATSFADDCVGHFLDALNKSKYRDSTIVILLSDHGYHLGDKNRWAKFTLWNQASQSPLIIRLPNGMIEPGVTDKTVSFLDVFPTITEILGHEKPAFLEGNSLLPLLADPDHDWKYPAVVTNRPENHSVLFENWNYIRYQDGSEELYDHGTDPDEHTNLAMDSKYRDLMDKLAAWIPAN